MSTLEKQQQKTGVLEELFKTMTNHLRRGYLEVSDGWVSPFNGIQYKYFSDEAANWTSASEFCSNMKGSLPLTTDLDFRLLRYISAISREPRSQIWVGNRPFSGGNISLSNSSGCPYFDIKSFSFHLETIDCAKNFSIMCEKPLDLLR